MDEQAKANSVAEPQRHRAGEGSRTGEREGRGGWRDSLLARVRHRWKLGWGEGTRAGCTGLVWPCVWGHKALDPDRGTGGTSRRRNRVADRRFHYVSLTQKSSISLWGWEESVAGECMPWGRGLEPVLAVVGTRRATV